MGAWSNEIMGNDTSMDIYSYFFEKYNEGEDPKNISQSVQKLFYRLFEDFDDYYDALFGLALAQWETKSLQKEILDDVRRVVNSGEELSRWKDRDGKNFKERERKCKEFLEMISVPRKRVKAREKTKDIVTLKEVVKLISPDNLKEFDVLEVFENGEYLYTSGGIGWFSGGGGGVFHYSAPNEKISLRWLDNSSIEIIINPNLKFRQKRTRIGYYDDEVEIIYK